ncbi:hopanoid biosynthesis-associated RND transporter HpnN [Bradyrhizobium retamae]|uniref:Hopanoid biosynthesis-associated RND transporter HpnN n=1 Tax=Bradyrhizobium retamae TaxID=1300035 RepID=A0A0R3MPL0_9BRAD|nr:hopanoid biosynthesis-associated RND transporter HpnN [Bradyrhizobium retamae]
MLLLGTVVFDATRFSIDTNIEGLISQNLPWHQRQLELGKAFPQKAISAVVRAPTAENAEIAADELAQSLSKNRDQFSTIGQPDSGDFFERNELLFASPSEIGKSIAGLAEARPFLSQLAGDPSLRGIMKALSFAADLVQAGKIRIDQLEWPLSLANRTMSDVLSGKPASFSWQELLQGHSLPTRELRHFIEVAPKLDFNALQPGRAAEVAIHQAATDLNLKSKLGATVQLTGQVPMNDDQFSVISNSALRDTLTALLGVLVALWLALRSWKLIVAVLFSLMVGLAATAALGLAMVGSFNLISIAFFVLFVGLGVDFGIQFSVRYRSERHEERGLRRALRSAARKAGNPLAMAAAATAVGFFAFLPTSYQGLSELGLIAGCGMLIAFACSITLVPAMLAVLNPGGEVAPVGFGRLAPLDDFLQRHRIAVIVGTIGLVLAGTPLLLHSRFDFNPVDLQSSTSPSVVTYRQLQNEPQASASDAEILEPSEPQAVSTAKDLAALPEVSQTLTLDRFVPSEQHQKIAALRAASQELHGTLNPARHPPVPDDQETIAAIRSAADALAKAAAKGNGPSAEAALNVSRLLARLASAAPEFRSKAEAALVPPLTYDLNLLRKKLAPEAVTIKTLPPTLVRDWVLPDGRARVEVMPRGDPNNANVLRRFATAVLRAAPLATGAAISYYESGNTVITAFVEAGVLALLAIAILLFVALRRVTDVLLTLIPLLLAGIVTLELSVIFDLSLNFANIIALPLLLGVGVAFKIYYMMAWRAGKTGLLQSTLTRAVVFSAMTNAAAFGSMWASNYPGMSSMGKLMALALLCTMAAAVLFQPVLMGRPRQAKPLGDALQHLPKAAE